MGIKETAGAKLAITTVLDNKRASPASRALQSEVKWFELLTYHVTDLEKRIARLLSDASLWDTADGKSCCRSETCCLQTFLRHELRMSCHALLPMVKHCMYEYWQQFGNVSKQQKTVNTARAYECKARTPFKRCLSLVDADVLWLQAL